MEFKGEIDLVTDADRASEAAILALLRGRHPDHEIVAEESARSTTGSAYRWYVDPLDGTTNYAHGVPHFCVSVGVSDEGGLAAGAIFQPLTGDLYQVARGRGAFRGAARLAVSTRAPLSQALVATGFPYDVWHRPDRPLTLFSRMLVRARGIRRFGVAALDLAYVAEGRFDGYLELGLRPWDVAAGTLLVQEAGGVVTDLSGGPARLDGGEIVAGNPVVHAELLALSR